MRGVLALRLSSDEKAALARAAKAKGVPLSSFVREAALVAADALASHVREQQPVVARDESEEVPESLEEVMARVWASSMPRAMTWWERDALGIPPSEDYWAWRRRVRGY
jgi:uncharacterized protein (DUF1778 family)